MKNAQITIRKGKPDDASRIASLIIMAMTEECCLYFCGEKHTIDDFHEAMTTLALRTDSQYSYLNTLCAVDEKDNIVGVCTSYDGALLHQLRKAFIDTAWERWGMDHSNMPDETQAGELYIDSLAVDPEYRGMGIAKQLLEATIQKSREMHLPVTGLLVDTGNPRAELLYNKVGFRVVDTNTWGGHPMKHMTIENNTTKINF